MIAALHVFGLAHAKAGKHAQAEQAYTRALAVARDWTIGVPTSVAARRYSRSASIASVTRRRNRNDTTRRPPLIRKRSRFGIASPKPSRTIFSGKST